jgi:hypothetical protein
MVRKHLSTRILLALLGAAFLPAVLYAQADFYKGKNLTIIQGRDPGGSGDRKRMRKRYASCLGTPRPSSSSTSLPVRDHSRRALKVFKVQCSRFKVFVQNVCLAMDWE